MCVCVWGGGRGMGGWLGVYTQLSQSHHSSCHQNKQIIGKLKCKVKCPAVCMLAYLKLCWVDLI